jgi:hemolysin III
MACIWAIAATLFLWRLTRNNRTKRIGAMIFGMSMIALYASSGLFHALLLSPDQLLFFQKLDQSCIYGLIAGTYTPIMLILLRGWFRTFLLSTMWIFVLIGVVFQWFFPKPPYEVTVSIYIAMGWLGLLGAWQYYRAVGWKALRVALVGGLLYTAGAVCEILQWPVVWPGVFQWHETLHLADMSATFCHFIFIMKYVLPYQHPNEKQSSETWRHRQAA